MEGGFGISSPNLASESRFETFCAHLYYLGFVWCLVYPVSDETLLLQHAIHLAAPVSGWRSVGCLTCISSALSAIWCTLSLAAKRKPMAWPDILPAARAILGMSFGPAQHRNEYSEGRKSPQRTLVEISRLSLLLKAAPGVVGMPQGLHQTLVEQQRS